MGRRSARYTCGKGGGPSQRNRPAQIDTIGSPDLSCHVTSPTLAPMTTAETLDQVRARILSDYGLLFLKTFEEERWEAELAEVLLEVERGLVTWTITDGPLPPPGSDGAISTEPLWFLERIDTYPSNHVFLLKDFQPCFADVRVIRRLRDLAPHLAREGKTLLFLGAGLSVPLDLQKEAFEIDLPLPGIEEIRQELQIALAARNLVAEIPLEIAPDVEEKLVKGVLGLTAREARKALQFALQGRETVDDEAFRLLVAEKRHLVEGSDLLEFYDLEEGVRDVGGLEVLKDWLSQRAEAFTERAREQGIPLPKGLLLLGVQGCGKSLTARATARLLSFPLVRLDVANLLSADRGTSERNLRDVLRLMETIAPAVLWLDEIEKGFAGLGEDAQGQDSVMARLFGSFLTWMEGRKQPVFVVATANSVANLPPELLRRGRFDELFFVDLPNYHERLDILGIHLSKRGWKPEKYDLESIANRTEGFSGAELEQIVVAAMIDSFGQGRLLSQEDLEKSRDQTVPLSVTMEEKVFELREWASSRCRRATLDSRVTKMIEDEHRRLSQLPLDEDGDAAEGWQQLAEHGQVNAGLVEYLRRYDTTTFATIVEKFGRYFPGAGEQGLALRSDPNVVLWAGLSPGLAETLANLIANRRIYVHPVPADVYRGGLNPPKLPAITQLPDGKLAKPGWFPAALRLLPPPGGSAGRFGRVTRIKLQSR